MDRIKRVLLVDDDSINNELNTYVLKSAGYLEKIDIALNGLEAIRIIRDSSDSEPPNIIFLDLNMPIMNGFEFLEEYQELMGTGKKDTKIYILTSSNNEKDLDKAKKYDIDGYVTKPLTTEKAKMIINK